MSSRRGFLKGGSALAALTLTPSVLRAQPPVDELPGEKDYKTVFYKDVSIKINGRTIRKKVDTRTTLLDLLREDVKLIGTKKGCNHGACGACTVHMNGKNINACLQLAVLCDEQEIVTVEGLADGETLHPIQAAFIEHDGFQCGYCTSGQLMSAVALINDGRAKTRPEIKELMSGNLCRCGAHNGIVDAIEDVQKQNNS